MKNIRRIMGNIRTQDRRNRALEIGVERFEPSESLLHILTFDNTPSVRVANGPCVLYIETITPYPAIEAEYGVKHRGFGGYRVPLVHFKDYFCSIRFRGAGNGKKVVCGYVVDNKGCIESVATVSENNEGWASLPLTAKSHALYASVPMKGGRPLWEKLFVELL